MPTIEELELAAAQTPARLDVLESLVEACRKQSWRYHGLVLDEWVSSLRDFQDDHPLEFLAGARAPQELIELGMKAIPLMLELVRDWEEPVDMRRAALWVVDRLGSTAIAAVDPLMVLLSDPRFDEADELTAPDLTALRIEISETLGAIVGDDLEPLIGSLGNNDSWSVRVGAAIALRRRFHDPSAVSAIPSLVEVLNERDWNNVEKSIALITALREAGPRSALAIPTLIHGATVQDLQADSISALVAIGPDSIPELIDALYEPLPPTMTPYSRPNWEEQEPRYALIDALLAQGDGALLALLEAIEDESRGPGPFILNALYRIVTGDSTKAVEKIAASELSMTKWLRVPSTAFWAASLLGEIGTTASLVAIEEAASTLKRLIEANPENLSALEAKPALDKLESVRERIRVRADSAISKSTAPETDR